MRLLFLSLILFSGSTYGAWNGSYGLQLGLLSETISATPDTSASSTGSSATLNAVIPNFALEASPSIYSPVGITLIANYRKFVYYPGGLVTFANNYQDQLGLEGGLSIQYPSSTQLQFNYRLDDQVTFQSESQASYSFTYLRLAWSKLNFRTRISSRKKWKWDLLLNYGIGYKLPSADISVQARSYLLGTRAVFAEKGNREYGLQFAYENQSLTALSYNYTNHRVFLFLALETGSKRRRGR